MFLFFTLFLSFILAALLIFLGRTIMFLIPVFHGPVFVPSKAKDIKLMIDLAKIKKTDKVIDIGSGDGEIVIQLAKSGIKAEGCDINPILIRRANKRIKKLDLEKLAKVYYKNFWDLDFKNYDVVMLYGTTYIMKRLEKKLLSEFKKGSRVVSNYFQFPSWKPVRSKGKLRVYIKS